jgi:uncharacterized membrane protein
MARNRRGVTAPIVALALPVMLGAIGFGIDAAMIELKRTSLQTAADAAATAGARQISSRGNVTSAAIALAVANLPTNKNGNVLAANDVNKGYWNPTGRSFTPDSVTPANNAVEVTTRCAATNGN